MCGIAGIARFDGQAAEAAVVQRMADRIAHRGPDDSGIYTAGAVAFALAGIVVTHRVAGPFKGGPGTMGW